MNNGISCNQYLNNASDDKIWRPIKRQSDIDEFDKLYANFIASRETGTKDQKGKSLEKLMTFLYERFTCIEYVENKHTNDNQIDHFITFEDGAVPTFIHQYVGLVIVGESKNHSKSISSREVCDLHELLRDRRSKLGIFSAYNSFSRGSKSLWCKGEGKRRKLALSTDRFIIGFNAQELKSLKEENFYTLIKYKYKQIIDELGDDYDEDEALPHHESLHEALIRLSQNEIITHDQYSDFKKNIEKKYGKLTLTSL